MGWMELWCFLLFFTLAASAVAERLESTQGRVDDGCGALGPKD